jgi:hypothetical protein
VRIIGDTLKVEQPRPVDGARQLFNPEVDVPVVDRRLRQRAVKRVASSRKLGSGYDQRLPDATEHRATFLNGDPAPA